MTPEQAKQLLPVITAFAEGKTIQFERQNRTGELFWEDHATPDFTAPPECYRIKPEVVRYKRYLWRFLGGPKAVVVTYADGDANPELAPSSFIRWIDNDWIEEEV